MFPYVEVFGKMIGSYAICAMVGFLVCGIVACSLARSYKIAYEDIILVMVTIGVSLLLGGHLFYGMTNMKNVIALFQNVSSYRLQEIVGYLGQYFGGMVYYGGFLGACAGLVLHTKFSKAVSRAVVFDLFAVCIPLFHVFGRIGCFFSGCCYGIESSWGFVAHGNTLVPELNDVMRMPVSLLEAACNLVIFLVLLCIFSKRKKEGNLIWYYMLLYPAARFVLEFFRGDAIRGIWFGLSTSQWISMVLFGIAAAKLLWQKGRKRGKVVCAAVLAGVLCLVGGGRTAVYATETTAIAGEAQAELKEGETRTEATETKKGTVETGASADSQTEEAGEEQLQGGIELRPVTAKEKFVLFVCFLFAVSICIIVVIWGDPRERERMQNKKIRKKLAEEAARKAAREERLKRQAEEARKKAQEETTDAEVKVQKE